MKRAKRWPIAASVVLALALAAGAPARGRVRQTDSSTSSAAGSKPAVRRKSSRKHHSKRVHLQAAPTPDRISEIQSALGRGGYYQGDPSGKWDSDTVAAVQKFQSSNGLDSTGKLDAPTLQKLGLGSDIAGVSAPKPVVPKCCSTPAGSAPPSSAPPNSTAPPSTNHAAPPAQPLPPSAPAAGASNSAVSDPKSPQH